MLNILKSTQDGFKIGVKAVTEIKAFRNFRIEDKI